MPMKNRSGGIAIALAIVLGCGCVVGESVEPTEASFEAGDLARASGIARYQVTGAEPLSIRLLDGDDIEIGEIRIVSIAQPAPTPVEDDFIEATREVRYRSGAEDRQILQVAAPTASPTRLKGDRPEEAALLDPALAETLAGRQLSFAREEADDVTYWGESECCGFRVGSVDCEYLGCQTFYGCYPGRYYYGGNHWRCGSCEVLSVERECDITRAGIDGYGAAGCRVFAVYRYPVC